MKKIISFALMLSMCMALLPGVHAAQEDNLSSHALITTNIPQAAETIRNVADGNYKTSFEMNGESGLKFPYYIEFDFYNYNIRLKDIRLYAANGEKMGVNNIDVQYYDTKWRDLKTGILLDWNDADTGEYKKRTVHFSEEAVASKVRININAANTANNQFEISEIEIAGSLASVSNSKKLAAVKTAYVQYAMGKENDRLNKTVLLFEDGTSKEAGVQYHNLNLTQEGVYLAEGSIPLYDQKAYAVVDVYDTEKTKSQFNDTWCENVIQAVTRNGLLSGMEFNMTTPVSMGDFALLVQRIKGYDIEYSDNKTAKELVFDAVNKNLFAGKEQFSGTVTRKTAIEYLMETVDLSAKEKINTDKPGYTDVQSDAVNEAYAYGLLANGAQFRPDDAITYPELAVIVSNALSDGSSNAAFTIEKEFTDNKKALVNPYMGLFTYYLDNGILNYDVHYDNDDYFEDLEGVSNVYLRFPWGEIQPTKDEFDFSIVDYAIQKFSKVGKQVSLRFTVAESSLNYATPKWVFDEGAKVHWWGGNEGKDNPMPYFDDPIFLSYLDQFLEQAARRYDGNPNIAYIDIGSLGIWGEGHTGSAGYVLKPEEARKHLELYHKHFKKTKVVCLDDLGYGYTDRFIQELKPDLIKYGFGLRNDGYAGVDEKMRFILEEDKTLGDGIWENAPIIIEPEHYSEMLKLDIWGDAVDLAHWIDTVHATYIGLHGYSREMYLDSPKFIEYANLRIGYRLLPEKIKLQSKANVREKLSMDIDWKNVAAAPCYNGGYPALTLKDENGHIVSVMVDDKFNVKDLPVADPGKAVSVAQRASFRLNPILTGGTYKAYLSVGSIDGTPEIKLPIDAEQDDENRYYIGDVEIVGDYSVKAAKVDDTGAIKLDFDFHRNNAEPYKAAWMYIAYREVGGVKAYMPGDMYQNVEKTDAFINAANNNGKCTIDVKLEIQNKFRRQTVEDKQAFVGRKFEIYYIMDSMPTLYLSDRGRDVYLGVAEVDENLNMIFTPAE